MHEGSNLLYSLTRVLKPADPCLQGPGYNCIHRTVKATRQRFECI
nr:MAG TPA: hypothetical protein [Caudoviricetes sp.]